MSANPEHPTPRPLGEEEKQLRAHALELHRRQLEFLDAAGKRFIELATGMLGLLFAVLAFGKDFPPPYLQSSPAARGLLLAALGLFFLSLLSGVICVQPRAYGHFPGNLSAMRGELEKATRYKVRWMHFTSLLFALGALALVALVAWVVMG